MATELGGWTVQKRLGRGGMGTVYHCTNTLVPSIQAAVKTMDPALARSRRSRARFIREAEVLFGLDHPHIVKVRNLQMDHDPPFLEMAFVEGRNLGSMLSAGVLTRGAAMSLAAQLCSALHHMQERGVFHRDIKPDNIILSGEDATLVDFGLVTEDDNATLSRPGALFGTLQYVPPEWGGATRPEGGAWDRYSLGVVIYEALTGTPAFLQPATGTFVEQLTHVQDAKKALPFLDPGGEVPEAARAVVRALTARAPEDRHCDLQRAADDLTGLRHAMTAYEADRYVVVETRQTGAAESGDTWVRPLTGLDEAGQPGDPTVPLGTGRTAVPESLYSEPPESPEPAEPSGQTLVPPESLDEAPPPVRSRSKAPFVGLMGLGVLGAAAVWFLQPAPPPPADPLLDLVLSPETVPLPVVFTLDDTPLDPTAPPRISPGNHTLRAVVGTDCGTEAVPIHCGEVRDDFVVDPSGTGARRRLRLPEVNLRDVRIVSSTKAAVRVRDPGGTWTAPSEVHTLTGRLPGPLDLVVQAGTCPDAPCGTDCPPTCAETTVAVVVPFAGSGAVEAEVELHAPVAPKRAAGPPPLVSVGRFARWLARHPEYERGGAATSGLSARYLRGWSGRTPPPTLASGAPITSSTPVEAVSASVARKVCAGRGGLRKIDAAPQQWVVHDGGATPWFELRQHGDKVVLLQSDGARQPVTSSDAKPMVGFRCQR